MADNETEDALKDVDSVPAIAILRKWFEDSVEAFQDADQRSERDRDFYDGIQWTATQIRELEARGQPIMTSNMIRKDINTIKGLEIQSRTQPKAWARNPGDENAADAATDALRFVYDNTKYSDTRTKLREEMAIEGSCYIELGVEFKGDQAVITNRRIPWSRGFIEPHSSENSGLDAKYLGEAIWMDLVTARLKWPDKEDVLTDSLSDGDNTAGTTAQNDKYEDKPREQVWSDKTRKRIRIIRMNYKFKGVWNWAVFTFSGLLSGGTTIPYLDEDGEPWNNILTQATYVDRDNQRSGVVRDMISPQKEVNMRKSKALHLMTMRQFKLEKGSGNTVAKVKKELNRADGGVELNKHEQLQIIDHNDQISQNLALMQEAKNEINNQGPNPALSGQSGAGDSGIAIQRQQVGGFTPLTPYMDAGRNLDIRVYEGNWLLIKQFWKGERWIRITDDENKPRFIGISRPTTVGEEFVREKLDQGIPQEEVDALVQALPPQDQEAFDSPSGSVENDPAEINVDIILDEITDLPTLRHEEFILLAGLLRDGIPIPIPELIANSTLRNKDKIIEKMEAATQNQAAQQAAAQAAQLEAAGKQADTDKTVSETMENQADTALKIQELETPLELR